MSYVRSGVTAFINAFAGTPIKLQIVRFSSTRRRSAPHLELATDMLVDTDVADLKAYVNGGSISTGGSATALSSTGSTNWEDGIFRMFLNNDGTVQQVLPDTVIMFTDGMPTYNRLNGSSATAPATMLNDDIGLPAAGGSSYNQLSWNRANRLRRVYEADLE
jgi:hypothetical protein